MAIRELFLPLEDADFLVPGERVYYRRRRHLAALIQPVLEWSAATIVFAWMLLGVPLLGQSLIVSGAVLAVLLVLGRQLLRIDWKTPKTLTQIGAFGVLVYATQADLPILGLVIVTAIGVRLALRVTRWMWFQRLLITDRRVIEIDGLFSSSVATMPIGRVTDALLHRSALAEVLGYAEFRVESAGQHQALARINFLDDPDRFHLLIVQLAAGSHPLLPQDPDAPNPPQIFDQYAV